MLSLPPSQITKPHFFIIESLNFDDEREERFDGKFLYNYLKMLGKEPKYYYIRTKKELERVAEFFRESGYRYLYLSCHGNENHLFTTCEDISFIDFAEIFKKKLEHRRIFISGCSLGRLEFAQSLYSTNGGMYTMTAPLKKVTFQQMLPFWSSFFYLLESFSSNNMKSKIIHMCLEVCVNTFDVNMVHFFKAPDIGVTSKEFIPNGKLQKDILNCVMQFKNKLSS